MEITPQNDREKMKSTTKNCILNWEHSVTILYRTLCKLRNNHLSCTIRDGRFNTLNMLTTINYIGNEYFFWPLEGNTDDGMNLQIQRSFFQLQLRYKLRREGERDTRNKVPS